MTERKDRQQTLVSPWTGMSNVAQLQLGAPLIDSICEPLSIHRVREKHKSANKQFKKRLPSSKVRLDLF